MLELSFVMFHCDNAEEFGCWQQQKVDWVKLLLLLPLQWEKFDSLYSFAELCHFN